MMPIRSFLAAAAMLLGVAPPCLALINPDYTPVDLVRQSELILRLELSAPDAKGAMAVKVVEACQGKPPAKLAMTADLPDKKVADALAVAFAGGRKTAPALLLAGDFSAASDEAAAQQAGAKTLGALHLAMDAPAETSRWFALLKAPGGKLLLAADPLDMKAVWAGSNAQLLRAVKYIQSDPRAHVPVRAAVHWGHEARLGKIAGRVNGALAVAWAASSEPHLLVLADGGDRLYAPAAGGKLADVTARRKLTTKSRQAAVGDFNGDGRLDLASSDGKVLSVALGGADGAFEIKPGAGGFGQAPIGLAAIGGGAKASLLVSTPAEPVLMTLGADGLFTHKPLPKPPGGLKALGQAGPCAVADFDGDGAADVLQPFAAGALLYKGTGGGAFAAPLSAADGALGGRPAGAAVADFDADGRLDVLLTGKGGCCLLHNLGGRFRETLAEAGEVSYTSQRLASGGVLFDVNNDGRVEFLLTRTNMPPLFYFNRGFACFGYAGGLELADTDLGCVETVEQGQQGAAAADFNGDGAQDVALVAAGGEVWVLYRDASEGATLGLTVALPPGAAGPVTVRAADGKRALGARLLAPGASVLFGKVAKGPLTLSWQWPGVKARSQRIIVLKPTRFVLPAGTK